MSFTNETENISDTVPLSSDGEIGYPVHVYFIELAKMYMKRIRWHWHPEIEVIIINHGEANFITEEKKICLTAGQGIIINQNTMHTIQSSDSDASCSLYSITFHPSFLFGYGNTNMSSKFLAPILSSPLFRIMLLDESDPLQEKLLDQINTVIAINLNKKFGYELTTKAHLCEFWLLLLEFIIPQNVKSNKNSSVFTDESRVKEAIIYIENHYAEPITLDQLAESIHVSKSECCRCFKRTLQISPIEYLMKYRIFKAASMIQNDAASIHSMSELAFNVGFNNASYFNKVFRQFLDCTPSQYKKNLKTDPTRNPFHISAL